MFPHSGGSLEKTPFPKDPFFRTRSLFSLVLFALKQPIFWIRGSPEKLATIFCCRLEFFSLSKSYKSNVLRFLASHDCYGILVLRWRVSPVLSLPPLCFHSLFHLNFASSCWGFPWFVARCFAFTLASLMLSIWSKSCLSSLDFDINCIWLCCCWCCCFGCAEQVIQNLNLSFLLVSVLIVVVVLPGAGGRFKGGIATQLAKWRAIAI